MRRGLVVLVCVACAVSWAPGRVGAQGGDAGAEIARANGLGAWSEVETVAFTWRNAAFGVKRSYVWDVKARTVEATLRDGSTHSVDLADPAQHTSKAYLAFINDSYWVFFTLHLGWDEGVKVRELPVGGKLMAGATRQFEVTYGDVGPTPGDVYVLHVGDDLKDHGWIYRRGGSDRPTLLTTRAAHVTMKGITVPTRFETGSGDLFISIEGLRIE
jgi:hypothetical protein